MDNPQSQRFILTAERQALLNQLLEQEGLTGWQGVPLPKRQGDGPEVLSFAQERLWFFHQMNPERATYNMPVVLHFEGILLPEVLCTSLTAITRRHEILRTTFTAQDGKPVQVVHTPEPFSLPLIDLSKLNSQSQEAELKRHFRREAHRPFDLEHGPLLRGRLFYRGEQKHDLFITIHHIVCDGWSINVLVRELTAYYRFAVGGEHMGLAPLSVQYADFAQWQRNNLQGATLETDLAYWVEQLSGIEPIRLPSEKRASAPQTFRGAQQHFELSPELSRALSVLAEQERASLFMVLLTAFKALIYRYTGQTDLAVGTPVANRIRPELENLIGFFVNTLVLRTSVAGNPSFRSLLSRVHQTTLAALNHQQVPFEQVVQAVRPERGAGGNPLFNVLFSVDSVQRASLALPQVRVEWKDVPRETSKFDLSVFFVEGEACLRGEIEYSTDLFEPLFIARLISHFQHLLTQVVTQPDVSVARLSLFDAAQRHRLLYGTTSIKSEDLPAMAAHQLFERQAQRIPATTALVADGKHLSYGALDRRANQWANWLREQGIGHQQCVGLLLPRSIEAIVAILAVLKAGGTYLPLDPTYPPARLAFMVADGEVPLVLTQKSLAPYLREMQGSGPDFSPTRLVLLEEVVGAVTTQPETAPEVSFSPLQAAYLLYTSGSMGRPKGVILPHQALINLIAWQLQNREDRTSRVLQFAPLSFDVSAQEILTTLGEGGTLVLPSQEHQRQDPQRLLSLLRLEQVERVFMPFVALQQLADTVEQKHLQTEQRTASTHTGLSRPLSIKHIVTAGEALQITPSLRALMVQLSHAGQCALENQYGPTETHVVSSYVLPPPPSSWAVLPPIGRAISNVRLYVLDANMEVVPEGISGELYVGGLALAQGYHRQPRLTATRFVPDPYSKEPGARVYRTGDLVRWQPDGVLAFLGRIDAQVKVRGFRVEPGEIETLLQSEEAVAQAAVVAVRRRATPKDLATTSADQELVAFVVWKEDYTDARAGIETLHTALQKQLPSYFIPRLILGRESLPLTPSGKVNYKALSQEATAARRSAPAAKAAVVGAGMDAFTGLAWQAQEEQLAGIWREVLGLERVSLGDNFFDLGGHSLLITRVAARLQKTFGVEIPIRALYEAATLAEMMRLVEVTQNENATPLSPLQPVDRGGRIPMSFSQRQIWFVHHLMAGRAVYNMPAAFRLMGPLAIDALAQSFHEVVRRHEVLRTTFKVEGQEAYQVIHPPPVEASLPLIDLSALPEPTRTSEQQYLLNTQAAHPFDLEQGPLVRNFLVRIHQHEHLLFFNSHHAVCDGWSLGLLTHEWTTLYAAFLADRPSPLADLSIQYADYATWQQQWSDEEYRKQEVDYWKENLKDFPLTLDLPTDFPRSAVPQVEGATYSFTVDADRTKALRALARREQATLFMVLLTTFNVLLSRYAQQRRLVVGVPTANRTRSEMEAVIGAFINMLPIRADVDPHMRYADLLAQIRQTALDAYTHKEVPFELMVDVVEPERDISRSPIFQVMFAMENTPSSPLTLPHLQIERVPVEQATSRFELSLFVRETDETLEATLEYNTTLFRLDTISRLGHHFTNLLDAIIRAPEQRVGRLPLLSRSEQLRLIEGRNDTATPIRPSTLKNLFEAQVARTPDRVALVCGSQMLRYEELNKRANQLAHRLIAHGVRPEVRVGICMAQSVDLIVTLWAVLKAGGVYLPLDPSYPPARLQFILQNAETALLITKTKHGPTFKNSSSGPILYLDEEDDLLEVAPETNPSDTAGPEHLVYIIYTSGSTGRPKGVMVTHANVTNFLVGMDSIIGEGSDRTWMALTSASFDISVLELLGTLTRGFKVVLPEQPLGAQRNGHEEINRTPPAQRPLAFSLFYFSSTERTKQNETYRLLLEGARFADQHGFTAIWTPERHFHPFGGIFPSPAITSAALATITERLHIRAGSVVLPLQDPLRIAEEWAMVDNLSNGRVGISFASGWHVNDFVLAPDRYAERREIMARGIETVRQLWRGKTISRTGVNGQDVEVRIYPKPVQPELPLWITTAGSPETFALAGRMGSGVLTHLLGQRFEELAHKIAAYRDAWHQAGHDGEGTVTLMLHTFIGPDREVVRDAVFQPFCDYLKSSFDLMKALARSMAPDLDIDALSEAEQNAFLKTVFDRFYETASLMGTPETCRPTVETMKQIGVDEVACLIDFGIETNRVLEGLEHLLALKAQSEAPMASTGLSVAAQLQHNTVTHLQCTPSAARLLMADPDTMRAMQGLQTLLIGGEELPASLAARLQTDVELYNVYGPTETTIWSTTHRVDTPNAHVPIGRPIVNTTCFIVDAEMELMPDGLPGELLIGGAGVVRGYHGQATLTAERFLPDPFSQQPGARLYRTGDRARWLPDGTLEFLGRTDHQVKIHGHRIETGEVEAVLLAHPLVKEAVVTVRTPGDEPQLVAYIVPEPTPHTDLPVSPEAAAINGHARFTLPNGLSIAHQHEAVSSLLYQEIFEQEIYLKHGIHLPEEACIFDVGANIGLFSLFVHQRVPSTKIYAFEPIPPTAEVLRANMRLHGLNARVLSCGLASQAGSATFTYYPQHPGLSSRYADSEKDQQIARHMIQRWMDEVGNTPFVLEDVEPLLTERFQSHSFECPLRTISDIIREEDIERIDLLKLDVEKSEVEVLRGIEQQDWAKIGQLVAEVDTEAALTEILEMLAQHGFTWNVEPYLTVGTHEDGEDAYVYMLYARHPQANVVRRRDRDPSPLKTVASDHTLQLYLREQLPSYMIPARYIFLEELPLTPNNKVDRKALPDLVATRPNLLTTYIAPRTETETMLAAIWSKALRLKQVGVRDNFFELGGSSLLLAQVFNEVRGKLFPNVKIVDLFQYPTIEALATFLTRQTAAEGAETAPADGLEHIYERARRTRETRRRQQNLDRED